MEMSREGVAGWPGGPVPDRTWMEMSASISSARYRVACTVSATYGQGLGEAGQIRGADRGTSAVPGRLSRDAVGPSDLNLLGWARTGRTRAQVPSQWTPWGASASRTGSGAWSAGAQGRLCPARPCKLGGWAVRWR